MDWISWRGPVPRRLRHSFKNLDVSGTAAKVAGKPFPDLLDCGIRFSAQQMMGRENHPGCADAALRAPAFQKSFLQTVQALAGAQSLDRNNVRIPGLEDRYEATVDQRAVQQHGARAALTFATSLFCAGQFKLMTQHIQQSLHRMGPHSS